MPKNEDNPKPPGSRPVLFPHMNAGEHVMTSRNSFRGLYGMPPRPFSLQGIAKRSREQSPPELDEYIGEKGLHVNIYKQNGSDTYNGTFLDNYNYDALLSGTIYSGCSEKDFAKCCETLVAALEKSRKLLQDRVDAYKKMIMRVAEMMLVGPGERVPEDDGDPSVQPPAAGHDHELVETDQYLDGMFSKDNPHGIS